MKLQVTFLSIFLLCFSTFIWGQEEAEPMDLQQCIEFAWSNNIQVKQTELNVLQSKLGEKQAYWAFWPSANASFRHGGNFGRSIDFTSYQFVNDATHSSQLSLSSSIPIYQGLQLRNTLNQSKIDVQASEKDVEATKENIGLSVAQAYLAVLMAEEQVEVLKEQAKVTKAQYEQTLKLIKAGTLPDNNRFELEAQMARDEQGIVNAENSVELAYTNLKVLMNMDVASPIQIQKVDFQMPEEENSYELDPIYDEASTSRPNIIAARMREKSATLAVDIAKGALQPTVSFYGSLTSNFSSAQRERTLVEGTQNIDLQFDLFGTPITVPVGFPTTTFEQGRVTPYFDQIWNNLYANVGVSLNVPIFNSMRARIAIEQAELGVKIAQLNTRQAQVQLKSDIQRAIIDVKAAEKSLIVAEKSLKATKASVDNTRKRFNLGVVNGFEMISAQNMLIAAESSLLQSKYDYLFKLKVLDFYRGITLLENE
jgi:outer membrane protein